MTRLIRKKEFKMGDKVLLFNSRLRLHPGKLKSRWTGPYIITHILPFGVFEISRGEDIKFKVNGHRLKAFYENHDTRWFDEHDLEASATKRGKEKNEA